ncbi:hypothetical protein [Allofrancisella frigidaquae]|uniref:Uncharacterized protein n=1 Tax=Allofrancisella frigidaquae TaxID=1085644 RepID=A0A6M3HRW3_9GAMM|nr:hypothetical protein [Allofrancisella frigidaquae]QIV93863.1 hypothetical protein E3E15_00230 [Allofrancisella frigidaquae]
MVNNKFEKCIIHGEHNERFPQMDLRATILYSSSNKDKLFLHLENSIEYKNKNYNYAVATIRSKSCNDFSYGIIFFSIDTEFEVCKDRILELEKSWRGGLAGLAGISFLD